MRGCGQAGRVWGRLRGQTGRRRRLGGVEMEMVVDGR